ncbi:hypothetical protein Poli38472_004915 [Pythium oligandrum]|uniref:Uncharacterized protein n=1 Tax=Pythium oligandrum TaxID=41045 RepID=A0A8K1CBD3_PYTOL|nr:hypothetical protein Poli38472_004915 [Pythium oligandrum]|eukprot:TMW59846.1 hypothetical protein Poli38472_004915 [Pythium oligandrum]
MNWLELDLDDDPALLDAALHMLDTLDDAKDCVSPSRPSEGETTTSDASGSTDESEELRSTVSPEPKAPKVNRSRDRRKEELLTLRAQAKQLEETLVTLKRRRVEQESTIVPSGGRHTVWKHLAGRQQHQRRETERENTRLREMLNTQLQVSKELMRLIHKGSRQDPNARKPRIPHLSTRDVELTDVQRLARLDELYRLTNGQILCVPVDPSGATVRDIKVHHENAHTTFVNFVMAWSVPFATARVLDAVWQMYAECPSDSTPARLTNEAAGVFRLHSGFRTRKMIPGEIIGRTAAKRFLRTANGDSLILSSMAAKCVPLDSFSANLTPPTPTTMEGKATYYEDSWIRVSEARSHEHVWSEEPLTQIQINRQMRFHVVLDDEDGQEHMMRVLTEIVLAYVEEEITWKQQMIENGLISGFQPITC